MLPAVDEAAKSVVVDLSGCTFVDSSALAILLELNRRLQRGNGALKVVAAAPAVRRPFDITGLDRLLALYPTRTAALDGEG